MQQGDLLWVNADAASCNPSKSRPETKFAINSHIQRYRKRNEQASRNRSLLKGSAARAIVGWTTRSTSSTPSPVAVRESSEAKDTQPTPKLLNETPLVHNQTHLIRSICGKGEAVDPFDCVATKLDGDTVERLVSCSVPLKHVSVSAEVVRSLS